MGKHPITSENTFFCRKLEDEIVRLKPAASSDFDALYAVASDPLIWQQHNAHDRWKEKVFRPFFKDGLANDSGMYLILDKRSDAVMGGTRFYHYDPSLKAIRIGYTFLDRAYWGKGINLWVKKLMLNHAFQKVTTVYFDVYKKNFRSQQALKKLGAQLEESNEDKLIFRLNKADWKI